MPNINLSVVDAQNWRAVSALAVKSGQRDFVAEPSYYLALCCYSDWNPLAVLLSDEIIGFMMWGVEDDSYWLGGILIDAARQGKGYGRKAVQAALDFLVQKGATSFALSYAATNLTAKHLYKSLGFVETGELEDDEVIARLKL